MKSKSLSHRRKMLEYYKLIIDKVSFSAHLFEKELKKAIRAILPDDMPKLMDWAYQKYGSVYRRILDALFKPQSTLNAGMT